MTDRTSTIPPIEEPSARPCRPGTVYLVGAGPGNPDLITVRGLQLVQCCDVLVYDNLLADEFVALSLASEKIYVGKASGRHMLDQEEIDEILIDRARAGRSVVRLKGGDPFVFGRGGEECQALLSANIPYVVVPGVTAGIAGPAYAGIPVTHRELSRGVTLVTGHFSRNEDVMLPWRSLAGLSHTLVFYMAVAALPEVCRRLIEAGMDRDTPAAVIEQATTGSQRVLGARLGEVARTAESHDVRPPALLVVGRVAELERRLAWVPPQLLSGRTILFTRAAEREYEAVERLRGLGAKVVDMPVLQAVARTGDPDVERTMAALDDFGALCFTSVAAVEFFFDELHDRQMDARRLAGKTVVASSPSVAQALLQRGVLTDLDVQLVRQGGVAAELARAGMDPASRILVPRSSAAGAGFIDLLRSAGFDPHPLVIYDAVPADLGWIGVKMSGRRPDAIVCLSASGVDALFDSLPDLADMRPRPLWACVGRRTAAALEARGVRADVVPSVPDLDLLVADLVKKFAASP
jgi:uroporphyrinogen III methyltransferase/synthase